MARSFPYEMRKFLGGNALLIVLRFSDKLNLQDTPFPAADASVKIHKPSTTNMFTQICPKVTYSLQEAPFDLVNQQLAELRYRRDRKGGLR